MGEEQDKQVTKEKVQLAKKIWRNPKTDQEK